MSLHLFGRGWILQVQLQDTSKTTLETPQTSPLLLTERILCAVPCPLDLHTQIHYRVDQNSPELPEDSGVATEIFPLGCPAVSSKTLQASEPPVSFSPNWIRVHKPDFVPTAGSAQGHLIVGRFSLCHAFSFSVHSRPTADGVGTPSLPGNCHKSSPG